MGCFKACFGTRKRPKTKKPAATLAQDPNICHDREINEVLQCVYSNTDDFKMKDPIPVTSVIKENTEEEEKQSNEREKVAYHSDMIKSSQKELKLLVENAEEKETMKEEKSKDDEIDAEAADSGGSSSLFSYPPNHRYHNCTTSSDEDDESEVTNLDKSKTILIDEEKDGVFDSNDKDKNDQEEHEESSESLFSLPIDSRKEISTSKLEEKEVNSPLKKPSRIDKNRRQCIQSVLNPIENLSQWRSVKEKSTTVLNDQEKENKNMSLQEPIFKKSKSEKTRKEDDGIGMETSLSSWLKGNNENDSPVSVGTCSKKRTNNSSRSFDDRPILGELTLK